MYAKLPCAPSDHAKFTKESWLTEDKSKRHENKVCAYGNKLRTGKERRP